MFENSNENIDELKPIEPFRREKLQYLEKIEGPIMTRPDAKVGTVRYQYALMAMLVTTGNEYIYILYQKIIHTCICLCIFMIRLNQTV